MYWSTFNTLPAEKQLQMYNYPQEAGRYLARSEEQVGCPQYTHLILVEGASPWLKIKEVRCILGGERGTPGADVDDFFWGPKIEIPTPEFRLT